jgi:hypothetical protein
MLGDRLEPGSLYRLLADEGHRLFVDDYFADLYAPTHRGRPTIPARVVATVMLLQSPKGSATGRPLFGLSLICAGRQRLG